MRHLIGAEPKKKNKNQVHDATAPAPQRSTTLPPRPMRDARTLRTRTRPSEPWPAYRNSNSRSLPRPHSQMVAGATLVIPPLSFFPTIKGCMGGRARDDDGWRECHANRALGRCCPHPERAHCHCFGHGSHLEQQHHQLGSHEIVGSSTNQSTGASQNLKIPQEALDSARNQTHSGIGNREPSGPRHDRRECAERDDRQYGTDWVSSFWNFPMGSLLFFYQGYSGE